MAISSRNSNVNSVGSNRERVLHGLRTRAYASNPSKDLDMGRHLIVIGGSNLWQDLTAQSLLTTLQTRRFTIYSKMLMKKL